MKRRLAIAISLLMLSVLLVSCLGEGDDDNADRSLGIEGDLCTNASDCVDGLRCVDQHCVQDEDNLDGDDTTADGDAATDDKELIWISIPSGSFQMGSSDEEGLLDAQPRHLVTVSAFEMNETEVTNAQYVDFLNANGNICNGKDCVISGDPDLRLIESDGTWSTNYNVTHPLLMVTWHGAKAFCEWIGGRLPSEAEWEYAARAGAETFYYCGDDMDCLSSIAWYSLNANGNSQAVGQKICNAFGLYDMTGNVWEWVEDCWHENYIGAPNDGSAWQDQNCWPDRVLRSGSSGSDAQAMRLSYRIQLDPDFGYRYTGFRCIRDVTP